MECETIKINRIARKMENEIVKESPQSEFDVTVSYLVFPPKRIHLKYYTYF